MEEMHTERYAGKDVGIHSLQCCHPPNTSSSSPTRNYQTPLSRIFVYDSLQRPKGLEYRVGGIWMVCVWRGLKGQPSNYLVG